VTRHKELDPFQELTRREFLASCAALGVSSALVGCASSSATIEARDSLDILIRGGSVIDGTGAAEKLLDVGLRDGRIVALGNLGTATASRVIDATGLKVVPGFIDMHSHVDVSLFRDPRAESKVRQGVTTEVTGQDGESVAPLGGPTLERDLRAFREEFAMECPYRDMAGFFAALRQNRSAQNILSLVGLGTVRGRVVGMDDRPPTEEETDAMKREVFMAIEQGCWGASTGLEYTPGSFATADELARLMRAVPEPCRLYSTHMRNEADRLLEAITEAITIARSSAARLQVAHLKAQNKSNWPKQAEALRLLEDAIASGLNVHADRYPYVAFQTGLTNLFPIWSRDGGDEEFLKRLDDPATLARMKVDVDRKVDGLGSWDSVMISGVHLEEDKGYQGKTLQQIALSDGVDPFEFTVDLLRREKASVAMVGFGMDEAGTEMVLAWKNTIVASDAGAHSPGRAATQPHPRAYGTFPRAIGYYQRERRVTSLPEMVRKMTSLPAEVIGLADRGVISQGKAADIVLFDYATIADRATFSDPHQFPVGIPYVLVNGVPVVDGGVQTDALPGRVLQWGVQT